MLAKQQPPRIFLPRDWQGVLVQRMFVRRYRGRQAVYCQSLRQWRRLFAVNFRTNRHTMLQHTRTARVSLNVSSF